jgi:hypothetical protein
VTGLPEYVDYGALMTPPAPFSSSGTTLTGFWAQVDRARVAALCDKVFAAPSRGAVACRPIGQHAMLSWGNITRVSSQIPAYEQRGGVAEPQVAVWIPVAVRDPTRRGERFAMFIPYIWLDNAMSLATGRELFGYPKSWGWPEFPGDDSPRTWKLDVFGLDYTADALAARHPLLEVTEVGSLERVVEDDIGSLANCARHIVARLFERSPGSTMLGDIELGADLVHDLVDERMPNIFLKQVRDIGDGVAAGLQQIVQAEYQVVSFKAKPLLREHRLTVQQLDSHPVIDELGLRSQTLGVAYQAELDFNVGGGRVLWDAART